MEKYVLRKTPENFRFEDMEVIDYYCPRIEELAWAKEKLNQKLFAFGFAFAVFFILDLLCGAELMDCLSTGMLAGCALYLPAKFTLAIDGGVIGFIINCVIFALILGELNLPTIGFVAVFGFAAVDIILSIVKVVKCNKAVTG